VYGTGENVGDVHSAFFDETVYRNTRLVRAVCSGKNVAIKIQNVDDISSDEKDVAEEYRVLRDLSSHPNIPDFYGAFKNNNELWFVMEVRRSYVTAYEYVYIERVRSYEFASRP